MNPELSLRVFQPAAPLRGVVHSLWTLQGRCEVASPQLLVPNGCVGLVLNFGAPMEQLAEGRCDRLASRTLVMGEVTRPVTVRSQGTVDLLGVRFWPAAARWFLDAPMSQVVDGIADESPLCAALARALARDVRAAGAAERRRRLEAALIERLGAVPCRRTAVDEAVRLLVASDGRLRIDALARTLDVHRRGLERQFAREAGIGPKRLAGVLRFDRALRAGHQPEVDWAAVSADCGYFDQSHLIRDFRRFTGASPTQGLGGEAPSLTAMALTAGG